VLLGVVLQLIRAPSGQSNLLQNGLRWLWETWAVLSVVFVPLLLWSSFI